MSRKYGYVIVIHERVGDDEYKLYAVMEALKISPYQIDVGVKANLDTFSYDVSASEVPTFVSQMGEPDCFSFIKESDLTTLDLIDAYNNKMAFGYASLGVISLSKVPKSLKGIARLGHMFGKAEAYIDLDDCLISTAWTNIKRPDRTPVDIFTISGIYRSN
jgi:hypothetical protein